MTDKHIMIAANECKPEVEDEYNRWYNDVHLPMFFEYEKLKKASRYKLKGDIPGCSKYLSVYEFETEDDLKGFLGSDAMKKAIEDFDRKWKQGEFINNWGASYELIKRLER